ncbi:MAG: universal stress protein [Alphaproteobacteria bacterium]
MRSVLAVADGGPALEATVAAAGQVASMVKGQTDVLHVRDGMALVGNLAAASMAEGAVALIIEDNKNKVVERATRAKQAFERLVGSQPGASFIEREGNETELVVEFGRVSDLVVVGRPGVDDLKPEPAYVSASIYEAARPVMIVPPAWQPKKMERALIAWNGSSQSSRALGYAMPVLRGVGDVTVLSVGSEEDRAPTELVTRYLDHNGIKSHTATFDAGSGSARARGRALLEHVASVGADLLVMGAYGSAGMLRFLGLGGATGKVITACKVPVFLAH